ncbi:MAG: FKBP-type peptidyl-prolyl cis-trans isomerase [Planctomycetales bacterium]
MIPTPQSSVPFPPFPTGAATIDVDAPLAFTETGSGLKYRILRKGKGSAPAASATVEVHYHGWLDDGTVFDSSFERKASISFPLNRVIAGWTEGMQLVGEGGTIELLIPSALGYGARGAPPVIPPHATLHFWVELLKVR